MRAQILGDVTTQKQDQANRVKDFMNYQIMDQMKEYEPEFDQMLILPSPVRLYLSRKFIMTISWVEPFLNLSLRMI